MPSPRAPTPSIGSSYLKLRFKRCFSSCCCVSREPAAHSRLQKWIYLAEPFIAFCHHKMPPSRVTQHESHSLTPLYSEKSSRHSPSQETVLLSSSDFIIAYHSITLQNAITIVAQRYFNTREKQKHFVCHQRKKKFEKTNQRKNLHTPTHDGLDGFGSLPFEGSCGSHDGVCLQRC